LAFVSAAAGPAAVGGTSSRSQSFFGRGPNSEDPLDFRGKHDVKNPYGRWRRIDVIADGGHLQILVNADIARRAFEVVPNSGRIPLRTELAEIGFRRWDLYPLGPAPEFSGR